VQTECGNKDRSPIVVIAGIHDVLKIWPQEDSSPYVGSVVALDFNLAVIPKSQIAENRSKASVG
jgi:hypothetical protein